MLRIVFLTTLLSTFISFGKEKTEPAYPTSIINASPYFSGVGNGAIEQIKEIPQLAVMVTELAVSEEARRSIVTSFKSLTFEKVGDLAKNTLSDGYKSLTGGSDKDWHSKGKLTYELASTFFGGTLLKGAKKGLENFKKLTKQVDELADEPFKAAVASRKKLVEKLDGISVDEKVLDDFGEKLAKLDDEVKRAVMDELEDGAQSVEELQSFLTIASKNEDLIQPGVLDEFTNVHKALGEKGAKHFEKLSKFKELRSNQAFLKQLDELDAKAFERLRVDLGDAKLQKAFGEKPGLVGSWKVLDEVGESGLSNRIDDIEFVNNYIEKSGKELSEIKASINNAEDFSTWKLSTIGRRIFNTFSKPIGFGGDILIRSDKKLNILGRVNPEGSMGTKNLYDALKKQGVKESEMTGLFKPIPRDWSDMKVVDMNSKYWKEINKPHIDEIIANGGDIRFIHDPRLASNRYNLVSEITDKNFKKKCIEEGLTKIKTYMHMEYDYLVSKGYKLLDNGLMVKK